MEPYYDFGSPHGICEPVWNLCEIVATAICITIVCVSTGVCTRLQTEFQHNDFSYDGIGQNPEKGFTIRDSDTLVGSNLKQKNKRLQHVLCHLLSVSCHPNVNTKAPERTASNFYSVNLQTRMAGIHWQKAVTEQGTLQ